jgi:hydroxyacylglutathione hydrolase
MRRVGCVWMVSVLVLCGCASTTHREERGANVEITTLRENYNNVHLVRVGGAAVLIDAGLEADAEAVEERLREAGVDPAKLKAVIITHGHADHAGGAGYLHRRYGVPIIAGKGDEPLLAAGRNDTLCPTDSTARDRLEEDQHASYKPITAQLLVDHVMELEPLGGIKGQIVPIAGHTAGSLVVVVGDAIFVGDLFRGAIVGSGAAPHFYMCDLDDNRADIRLLLTEHPEAAQFYTGHFGPVSREEVEALVEEWDVEGR